MTTSKLLLAVSCVAATLAATSVGAADVSKPMPSDHSNMPGMNAMQMHKTGDVDHDFASMMRMHHQMGITMAQEELKNGKDGEMKKMAQKTIDMQQQEVKQLDAWLAKHKATPSGPAK